MLGPDQSGRGRAEKTAGMFHDAHRSICLPECISSQRVGVPPASQALDQVLLQLGSCLLSSSSWRGYNYSPLGREGSDAESIYLSKVTVQERSRRMGK